MIRLLNKEIRSTTSCLKRCMYMLVPFSFTILLYIYISGDLQHFMLKANQLKQANDNLSSILRGVARANQIRLNQSYDHSIEHGLTKDSLNIVTNTTLNGVTKDKLSAETISNGTVIPAPRQEQTRFFISGPYTGRLGNLMFEYASTLGIARSNNLTMLISKKHELRKYFNLSVVQTESGKPNKTNNIGDNGCCKFASRLMDIKPKRNVTVHTYLQSFKYFQNNSKEIRQEFQFNSDINATANKFIENVTHSAKNATLVGVHVRRGDLLRKDKIEYGYTTPNTSYFINAMDYFRNKYSNVKFIVCTDDKKWCEENLNLPNVVISRDKKPSEDMAILSKCDHTIMSTGTFSWWAAFLANGTTIYYKNWPRLGSPLAKEVKHEDYFMPQWIPMGEPGPQIGVSAPGGIPMSKTFFIGGGYTGRIGNLMFQYAARYSIGKTNNLTVMISNNSELHRYFKLSALKTESGIPENSTRMFESGCCKFTKSLTNIDQKRNVTVHTYLQSYKYWYNISDEIRKEFEFNEDINKNASRFHADITKNSGDATLVGIHVRRGDIVQSQRFRDFGYTAPNMTYFENAMKFFRNKYVNVKFILCTDNSAWSDENFNKYPDVIMSKGNSPVVDLAILSKCKHMIISTGSFGWWAGFLSNGTTIYYENWPRLGSRLFKQVVKEDYFLSEWIPMI